MSAYLKNPVADQTVTLLLPDGFKILDGPAQRKVPMPAGGLTESSVTWEVQGTHKPGRYKVKVESSNGASQSASVIIKRTQGGIFGSN